MNNLASGIEKHIVSGGNMELLKWSIVIFFALTMIALVLQALSA